MLKILYSAFKHTKNLYTSIIGDKVEDSLNSEFSKENWSFLKILHLISDIFFIKLPFYCPNWVPFTIKKIFFGENSTYLPTDNEYDEDGICMVFINGIISNRQLIELNRKDLGLLFNRSINVIHNVTDSIFTDLVESAVGKNTNELTEASTLALYTVCKKLLDKNIKKLVIICYSQGTIIAANVLNNLSKLGLDEKEYLEKLEFYCFANCATKMNYIQDKLPYMEHFANENDFVAKLGCNCNKDIEDIISIDGIKFIKMNKSGHLFNTHYINNFKINYPESKLLKYIKEKN